MLENVEVFDAGTVTTFIRENVKHVRCERGVLSLRTVKPGKRRRMKKPKNEIQIHLKLSMILPGLF